MSTRKTTILVCLVALVGAPGCWEQMSAEWWPQMKRQPAFGAFEEVPHNDQIQGFTPPEGTVPANWGTGHPDLVAMSVVEQDALANPVPRSLDSLNNGKKYFLRYCATCHGAEGLGDGPVAASSPFAPNASGPLPLVLPINGPMSMARVFSDGHIYTTISIGRGRMPNYNRIPAHARWDIVNYIRELNSPGGSK